MFYTPSSRIGQNIMRIELLDTYGILRIKTTEFLFDLEDLPLIKGRDSWYCDKDGYLVSSYFYNGVRRFVRFHRLVMHAKPGQCVDHINKNKADNRKKRSDWRNSVSVKKPIERSERQKNLLKTVAKSSKQRYVLIVGKSLPLQATDRFSVQRIAAIRQGRIRQKPIEKRKKEVIIIVSVYVLCVAVLTGLHTVSRNSVPRNVKR